MFLLNSVRQVQPLFPSIRGNRKGKSHAPTQLVKKRAPTENPELTRVPNAAGVERLAQELIQQAKSLHASPLIHNPGDIGEKEDVILDIEVEGVRCLLIRSQSRKTATVSITLSPREREIVRMIAKGYPNKTIAAVLDISSWTVCTHIRRVFAKLGVGSRAAMIAKLLEDGSDAGVTANLAQSATKNIL